MAFNYNMLYMLKRSKAYLVDAGITHNSALG